MNVQTQLAPYRDVERLPMRAPVRAFGKAGLITGRAFGYERYDVRFADGTTQHSVDRQHIELDFGQLRGTEQ